MITQIINRRLAAAWLLTAAIYCGAGAGSNLFAQGTTGSPADCCGIKPTFSKAPQPNAYNTYNGQIAAATCLPEVNGGYNPAAYAFGIIDLQNPTPPLNVNYPAPMYHGPPNEWTGTRLGTVFGVCFDDQ